MRTKPISTIMHSMEIVRASSIIVLLQSEIRN